MEDEREGGALNEQVAHGYKRHRDKREMEHDLEAGLREEREIHGNKGYEDRDVGPRRRRNSRDEQVDPGTKHCRDRGQMEHFHEYQDATNLKQSRGRGEVDRGCDQKAGTGNKRHRGDREELQNHERSQSDEVGIASIRCRRGEEEKDRRPEESSSDEQVTTGNKRHRDREKKQPRHEGGENDEQESGGKKFERDGGKEHRRKRRRRHESSDSYSSTLESSPSSSAQSSSSDGGSDEERRRKYKKDKKRSTHNKSGKKKSKEEKLKDRREKRKKRRHNDDSDNSIKKEKRRRLLKEAKKILKGHKQKGKADARELQESGRKIERISADDYFLKNIEFATWLKEDRQIFFSQLSSEETHKIFEAFVDTWNAGKLNLKYYEGIKKAPRTNHSWAIKKGPEDSVVVDEDEQYVELTRRKEKYERKKFQREYEVHLDEILPKRTGHERVMEMKAVRREQTRAREESPELMKEKDVMGGGGDFQERLARERARREKKRAENAAVYSEKLSAFEKKETAAMDQLRAMVNGAGGKITIPKRDDQN